MRTASSRPAVGPRLLGVLRAALLGLALLPPPDARAERKIFTGIGNNHLGAPYRTKQGQEAVRNNPGSAAETYVTPEGSVLTGTSYAEDHYGFSLFTPDESAAGRARVELVGRSSWPFGAVAFTAKGGLFYRDAVNGGSFDVVALRASDHGEAHRTSVAGGADGGAGNRGVIGMAAGDSELFVADNRGDRVRVYSLTLGHLRDLPVRRPRKLAVAPDGHVWAILGGQGETLNWPGEGARIVKLDKASGKVLAEVSGVLRPRAVAVGHGPGRRLLVGDAHPKANVVKIFDSRTGASKGVFGENILAGPRPGAIGTARFDNIVGVGEDAAGRMYVGWVTAIQGNSSDQTANWGLILQSMSADGKKLLWRNVSSAFIDNSGIDPGEESVVYNSNKKMRVDWSKNPDGTHFTVEGTTLDALRYPNDPRIGEPMITFTQAARVKGKVMTVVSTQWMNFYTIYRKGDGEIMVPAAMFTRLGKNFPHGPDAKASLWVDRNGDGQFGPGEWSAIPGGDDLTFAKIDGNGDVWVSYGAFVASVNGSRRVERFRVQGLSDKGVPLYSLDARDAWASPDMASVRQAHYDAAADVLYLFGYFPGDPSPNARVVGHHGRRYDNFVKGGGVFKARSDMNFPKDGGDQSIINATVATPYVFAGRRLHNPIFVYDSSKSGDTFVETFRWPAHVGGTSSGTFWPGTGFDAFTGLNAHRRKNGEYVLLGEDVSFFKSLMYRWCLATCPDQPLGPGDVTPPGDAGPAPWKVVDAGGRGDKGFSGGTAAVMPAARLVVPPGTSNSLKAALRTYRTGASFTYALPAVAAGRRVLRVYFIEPTAGAAGGRRTDVYLGSRLVMKGVDPAKAPGGPGRPHVRSVAFRSAKGGVLKVTFRSTGTRHTAVSLVAVR